MPKQGITKKLQIGQRRAGLRRRKPESDHINQPSDVTRGIPGGPQNSNRENKQFTRYKWHAGQSNK